MIHLPPHDQAANGHGNSVADPSRAVNAIGLRRIVTALLPVAPVVIVALLYLRSISPFVQSGDTGELVADAFLYQVPHPSGYPLYVNLYFVFMKLSQLIHPVLAEVSVFLRASLFTSLLSMLTVFFVADSVRDSRDRKFAAGIALCLGTSGVFWRYSVLPDVFALSCANVAAVLWIYLKKPEKVGWATFFFALSLTNHLLALILVPVIVHLWMLASSRKKSLRGAWTGLLVGIAAFAVLYGSMTAMHPASPYSWGQIRGFSDVIRHFLREDYGRTQNATLPSSVWEVVPSAIADDQFSREVDAAITTLAWPFSSEANYYWAQFLKLTSEDLGPVLICIFLGIALIRPTHTSRRIRETGDRRAFVLAGSSVLFVLALLSLVKIHPDPEGMSIVERFFLLPQLLLCFAATKIFSERKLPLSPRLLQAVAVLPWIFCGTNIYRGWHSADFSKNSLIEDYAINLLNTVPEKTQAVILAPNDTRYFALRYSQQILGVRPEAWVISPPLLFHPWYAAKLVALDPLFRFDSERIASTRKMDLRTDLLEPNWERHPFFVTRFYLNDISLYRLRWSYLGKQVLPKNGSGEAPKSGNEYAPANAPLIARSGPDSVGTPISEYDPARDVFSEYADPFLAQGKESFAVGDIASAEKAYSDALRRVPYCTPAMKNLCVIAGEVGVDAGRCGSSLKELESSQFDYY